MSEIGNEELARLYLVSGRQMQEYADTLEPGSWEWREALQAALSDSETSETLAVRSLQTIYADAPKKQQLWDLLPDGRMEYRGMVDPIDTIGMPSAKDRQQEFLRLMAEGRRSSMNPWRKDSA